MIVSKSCVTIFRYYIDAPRLLELEFLPTMKLLVELKSFASRNLDKHISNIAHLRVIAIHPFEGYIA